MTSENQIDYFSMKFPIWIKAQIILVFFRHRQLCTFLISLRCTRMEFSYSVKIFFAFNSNDIIIPVGRCDSYILLLGILQILRKYLHSSIAVRREHLNRTRCMYLYMGFCTVNLFSWTQHAKDWHCHNNYIKKQNWRKKFLNLFADRSKVQVGKWKQNLKIRLIKYFLWLFFPFL